jgi:hypothetical protein
MKRHIFAILAVLSLLVCVFFIAITAASFATNIKIPLGRNEEKIYTFQVAFGEMSLNGWLTDFGRHGVTTTNQGYLWCNLQKQLRPADQRAAKPQATGFSFSFPAAYPIIIFALLPLIWMVERAHRRKQRAARPEETSSSTL